MKLDTVCTGWSSSLPGVKLLVKFSDQKLHMMALTSFAALCATGLWTCVADALEPTRLHTIAMLQPVG